MWFCEGVVLGSGCEHSVDDKLDGSVRWTGGAMVVWEMVTW